MERMELRRVLLVEDEAATRTLLSRHLRRTGLEVAAVETGEAALHELESGAGFDVVVTDVHLPGLSGLDLASLILSRLPTQALVLITGDPDAALAREAISRGPVSYLLKPFELYELDAAVSQAQARRHRVRGWSTASPGVAPGRVPQGWLEQVDQRSFAGPGHGRRVARVALALSESLPQRGFRLNSTELVLASWSHELGRLSTAASDPVVMATEGARMLAAHGGAAAVVDGVCHMYERWDGSGGPLALSGNGIPVISQLLALADSLDHYIAAWLHAGRAADEATDRALGLVQAQSGSVFCPTMVAAAQRQRELIESVCGHRVLDSGAQAGSTSAAGSPLARAPGESTVAA